jgi:cleavage and polyadenylation specificity factor subunit 5
MPLDDRELPSLTASTFQVDKDTYALPGGKLKPGEEEVDGLNRKLRLKLAPSGTSGLAQPEWHVGELLATWTRPQFEPHVYPYCPPHVTRPVETRRVYIVHLPEKCFFAVRRCNSCWALLHRRPTARTHHSARAQVPKNLKLLAVPLMELHSGSIKFGAELAGIPTLLSRFQTLMHNTNA